MVPTSATLVEMTEVETGFPVNSMLKWVGWLQTICFGQGKRCSNNSETFGKKCDVTNKWRFKQEALPFALYAGHMDHHHLQCPTIQLVTHESPKMTCPATEGYYTVCPQSSFGVFKNCGAQTNWTSHMRFAADYRKLGKFFTDFSRPRCGLPW
jgi:hypothetical protein